MAINYAKIFNRRVTPQSQPIPGSTQVRNSGGGYSWQVDDWTRLDRFLILGAEGGTYYITDKREDRDARNYRFQIEEHVNATSPQRHRRTILARSLAHPPNVHRITRS